jgi:hypothetical protein
MKKIFNEGNQIHNFISSSGSGTVINYGTGSDFLTSYGSGSTSQKVTVPTVPVPVPQHWKKVQKTKPEIKKPQGIGTVPIVKRLQEKCFFLKYVIQSYA